MDTGQVQRRRSKSWTTPHGGPTGAAGVKYAYTNGAIPAGGDLGSRNTTVAAAELHCNLDPMCKGFTFRGTDKNPAVAQMLFKRMDTVTADHNWQSYTKLAGPATVDNATLLRPRPMWRGGKAGSAKGGLLALTAVDRNTGDATLNLFGLQKCTYYCSFTPTNNSLQHTKRVF